MENEDIKEELEEKDDKNFKKDHKNKDKKLIEELQNQINILNDKNMRVTAEMLNTVRRKDEERERLLKYSNESLILEILPIIDNFERALSLTSEDQNVINYQKGINMIYTSLLNVLTKYEVKEIDCLNKEFDPSFHQAVMTEEREDVKSNIVIEVMQKGYIYKMVTEVLIPGYKYKDRVLKVAKVKVNRNENIEEKGND